MARGRRTAEYRKRYMKSKFEPSYFEDEYDVDRMVAEEIKRIVENDGDWYDMMSFSFKGLKRTLTYFKVSGRSKLKTKEEMVERLLDLFSPDKNMSKKRHSDPEEEARRVLNIDL